MIETMAEPYVETWNGRSWTSKDGMASENELLEYLAGLIRVIKPLVAVETGTYQGDATYAMAMAMQDNGMGYLHTCDVNDPQRAWPKNVVFYQSTSLEMFDRLEGLVDFAFLDGGDRITEVEALLPKLAPEGYFLIHDTRRLSTLDTLKLAKLTRTMQFIDFNTPRGFSLFRNA